MSDRDALIAAICANPDDDTPRLVFADWLDENEPDTRRPGKKSTRSPSSWAALIRAECELARLRGDGSAEDAVFDFFTQFSEPTLEGVRWERVLPGVARRVELAATVKKLRVTSAKTRNRGLPRVNVTGVGWAPDTHRGFPGGVWIRSLEKLQKHINTARGVRARPASDLSALRCAPRRKSQRAACSGGAAKTLVSCNHLDTHRCDGAREPDTACVQKLSIRGGSRYWLNDHAARISGSPYWGGLRELTIEDDYQMSAVDAKHLFGASHLRKLTRIDAMNTNWTAETLEALYNSTELRSLRIQNSSLGDDAAIQLANMPGLANLRHLDLTDRSGNRGAGCSALMASPAPEEPHRTRPHPQPRSRSGQGGSRERPGRRTSRAGLATLPFDPVRHHRDYHKPTGFGTDVLRHLRQRAPRVGCRADGEGLR